MKKYRYLIQILNIIRAVKSDPSWIKLLNISSFVHWYTLAITVPPPGGFESNVASNPRKIINQKVSDPDHFQRVHQL